MVKGGKRSISTFSEADARRLDGSGLYSVWGGDIGKRSNSWRSAENALYDENSIVQIPNKTRGKRREIQNGQIDFFEKKADS